MPEVKLNLHQKLAKISELCDVLVKDAQAFNYKYVREEDVLAKVKAGFKKYGVCLYTQIDPGTLTVTPYTYEKYDKGLRANKTINEFIVQGQLLNTFVNTDNPEEKLTFPFAMVASQDDPSTAMGSALSYANRVFLLKFFQIPTTLEDPEQYRSKQKAAEEFEDAAAKAELAAKIKEVVAAGSKLIKAGAGKTDIQAAVAKYNDGNGNPAGITNVEVCEKILAEFKNIKPNKEAKEG